MPALTNPSHEKFALLVAADRSASDAYAMAGFRPDTSNATKLMKRPEVAARVSELQGEALEAEGITRERIVAEAARIAFADLDGFDEGHVLVPSEAEIWTDARGRRRTRVMADKLKALELLGRWYGLDRPAPAEPDQHLHLHAHVTPIDDIRARIAAIAARSQGIDLIEGASPAP